MQEPAARKQTWLTLGAAAELLGVSESDRATLGRLGRDPLYRTHGGHRRILEEDLQHFVSGAPVSPTRDTDRISDLALTRIKRRPSRGRQGRPAVLDTLPADVRDRLRLMGRQLVDLFARYMSSSSKKERFADDARTIGREYGRTLVASNVGLTTAVATFNSLRRSVEETASQIASESALGPEEAVEAIESILALADMVLEGMAEVYEADARR